MNLLLTELEQDNWTSMVGPDINPVNAGGDAVTCPSGLRCYCTGAPGAGILFKHVAALPEQDINLSFSYRALFMVKP